ncbi:MAG TPA: ABC transporter permease subunit [Micromonosporaceae bacterium]|nr:ABC transporter permease subunit [Micromonosporaceae bacterium]
MTATQVAVPARRGHTPGRLIAAEIMKIRTTNTWWLLTLGIVLFTALALTVNGFGHHFELYPPLDQVGEANRQDAVTQAAIAHSAAGLRGIAADMLTSGQFFGCLLAMLIGILVITNEYFHQTATATFMTNPHRTAVIMAKLVAAAAFGALFWVVSTIMNVVTTPIYLHTQHVDVSLTQWPVVRSVLLNLLAFVMWAVFGLGLGTLIRSQIGSVVTGMVVYLIGLAAVTIIFHLIYNAYPHSWVLAAQVISPAVASQVMINPGRAFDHAPPQWVGLLVMIGYTVVFGGLGVWLTRRRDIS